MKFQIAIGSILVCFLGFAGYKIAQACAKVKPAVEQVRLADGSTEIVTQLFTNWHDAGTYPRQKEVGIVTQKTSARTTLDGRSETALHKVEVLPMVLIRDPIVLTGLVWRITNDGTNFSRTIYVNPAFSTTNY